MKQRVRIIASLFSGFVLGASLVLGALTIFTTFNLEALGSIKAYVVESGSMAPKIAVGSVVFVQKSSVYWPGDIITFSQGGNKNTPVTHRIAAKPTADEFVTRGDANEENDTGIVKADHIIGRVMFSVPYAGYAVTFAQTPKGFILLVIIPATIIIYEELKNIKRELYRVLTLIKEKYHKTQLPFLKEIPREKNEVSKLLIVLPIVGAVLIFISATNAFFGDQEVSSDNILSAAAVFSSPSPSPTASPLPTP